MKKVLIWDMFPLTNTGGPSGYLYNVHQYLRTHPCEQITFLSDLIIEQRKALPWENRPLRSTPNSRLEQIWYQIEKAYSMCLKPFWEIEYKELASINVNQYEYVHVHIITHVSQFRRLFPNYTGKLILTIHCPCTWTEEILNYTASAKSKLNKLTRRIRPLILKEECKAYYTADYIMFPCIGAKEPYIKELRVKHVFEEVENKFFYVPSAIMDYHADEKRGQKLSELGIPKDAFVITYFGRHISVKGYDVLIEVCLRLLQKYPHLYVLCAGKGDIEAPIHPRWKELGFINNVDDLLPQANLYILPNKETYFDLITLQILRAGVPLLLSDTGGNKYFQELPNAETKGLAFFSYDNINQLEILACRIVELQANNVAAYKAMKESNRALYEKYFTLDQYIAKYIESINTLK